MGQVEGVHHGCDKVSRTLSCKTLFALCPEPQQQSCPSSSFISTSFLSPSIFFPSILSPTYSSPLEHCNPLSNQQWAHGWRGIYKKHEQPFFSHRWSQIYPMHGRLSFSCEWSVLYVPHEQLSISYRRWSKLYLLHEQLSFPQSCGCQYRFNIPHPTPSANR